MRYLILSDLHSGLEALESCLALARGKYDAVVCLGDIVGYGPDPAPVIDRIRQLKPAVIRGNHDKACCGITDADDFNDWARIATYWTRASLSDDRLAFLRDLPQGPARVGEFDIVHGSADDEDQYIMNSGQADPLLKEQDRWIVFFGHTHLQGGFSLDSKGASRCIPMIGAAPLTRNDGSPDGSALTLQLVKGSRYLVNPGSVGQPRDGDWRSAFAIFDDGARRVKFYRTAYDLAATQEKMTKAGLPPPLIRRLEHGR
ncbi:MAG: metallophosphoesterase family protein [Acidobacteriota bacterium]|nr:metallophosphoesterase family protein [Acidobacteriota bacterium]